MLEVIVAPIERKEELWNLFQEYAHELSQYDGEKRSHGPHDIHYPGFSEYWTDDTRTPFIILYDHEPIGFCLLRDMGVSYQISEFYIRPLHRRRGFGIEVVNHVKDFCKNIGRHDVLGANIYVNNTDAIHFWQRAGFHDTGRRTRVGKIRFVETEAEL